MPTFSLRNYDLHVTSNFGRMSNLSDSCLLDIRASGTMYISFGCGTRAMRSQPILRSLQFAMSLMPVWS